MQTQEKRNTLLSKKLVQFNIKKTRKWNLVLGNESAQTDNTEMLSAKTQTNIFQSVKK